MSEYSYWKRHSDRSNETHTRRRHEVRLAVLKAYGNAQCAICGFDDIRALEIDHINGGGEKHRQQLCGTNLLQILYREGFPDKDKYRVLCRNCNWIAFIEMKDKNKKSVTYSNKNYWPPSIIGHAVSLYSDGRHSGGIGAKEAFAMAVEKYNSTAQVKFVLPLSCCNDRAAGILRDMRKRALKNPEKYRWN